MVRVTPPPHQPVPFPAAGVDLPDAELFILLIDEAEAPTEETLTHAADHFLMVLRMRGHLEAS